VHAPNGFLRSFTGSLAEGAGRLLIRAGYDEGREDDAGFEARFAGHVRDRFGQHQRSGGWKTRRAVRRQTRAELTLVRRSFAADVRHEAPSGCTMTVRAGPHWVLARLGG
jgi:hypothetical protein